MAQRGDRTNSVHLGLIDRVERINNPVEQTMGVLALKQLMELERIADALEAGAAVRTHGRVFDAQGRLIYTAVDVEAGRRALERLLPLQPAQSFLNSLVHAVLKAVGGAFEEER